MRQYTPRNSDATARRQLASKRNWTIFIIKGYCSSLRTIARKYGRSGISRQLEIFEDQLTQNVKDHYELDKAKLS